MSVTSIYVIYSYLWLDITNFGDRGCSCANRTAVTTLELCDTVLDFKKISVTILELYDTVLDWKFFQNTHLSSQISLSFHPLLYLSLFIFLHLQPNFSSVFLHLWTMSKYRRCRMWTKPSPHLTMYYFHNLSSVMGFQSLEVVEEYLNWV